MGGQCYPPAPQGAVDGDELVRFGDEPWSNANGDQSRGRLLDSAAAGDGAADAGSGSRHCRLLRLTRAPIGPVSLAPQSRLRVPAV